MRPRLGPHRSVLCCFRFDQLPGLSAFAQLMDMQRRRIDILRFEYNASDGSACSVGSVVPSASVREIPVVIGIVSSMNVATSTERSLLVLDIFLCSPFLIHTIRQIICDMIY